MMQRWLLPRRLVDQAACRSGMPASKSHPLALGSHSAAFAGCRRMQPVSGSWQCGRPFFSGVAILRTVRQATSEVLRLRWS
jgi:hypothetical protein